MKAQSDASLLLQKRTAAHYDAYPFEFLTPADEREVERLQPAPFVSFVAAFVKPGGQVGEIGCGPGRGTMYLARRASVSALDLSDTSLRLAQARAPAAHFVRGSALALPFRRECFDVVVSDGVIHHTPDAHRAFQECARILKPGGAMYLGVYNRRRYYYYLYTYPGRLARALERRSMGRALVMATIFPVYYLAHLVKSRGKRTLSGAKNFFYDYLMTPRASFHTREEIESWARAAGLALAVYDPSLGNVHTFSFVKKNSN